MIAPDCWYIIISFIRIDRPRWITLSLVCKATYAVLESLDFTYKVTDLCDAKSKKCYKCIRIDGRDGSWPQFIHPYRPEYLTIVGGKTIDIRSSTDVYKGMPLSVKYIAFVGCNMVCLISIPNVVGIHLYDTNHASFPSVQYSNYKSLRYMKSRNVKSIRSTISLHLEGWVRDGAGYLHKSVRCCCLIL